MPVSVQWSWADASAVSRANPFSESSVKDARSTVAELQKFAAKNINRSVLLHIVDTQTSRPIEVQRESVGEAILVLENRARVENCEAVLSGVKRELTDLWRGLVDVQTYARENEDPDTKSLLSVDSDKGTAVTEMMQFEAVKLKASASAMAEELQKALAEVPAEDMVADGPVIKGLLAEAAKTVEVAQQVIDANAKAHSAFRSESSGSFSFLVKKITG
uniref:Uncharacterized protein n=1 Tax=Noctiluca scintillans TaxID=2966 RepID=A0A7S0ZXV2_NOCSC|mmetsp:Transcript_23611/g.62221  ORF Transcript_23611/g.62221 Transcript_23611/m.62221 type:complete len:218 (+) Transcript_23611:63-716(+)